MNVNGVTSQKDFYRPYNTVEKPEKVSEEVVESEDTGVVYEPTLEMPTKTYKMNEEILAKMKADADQRTQQLRELVSRIICKQGSVFNDANDIWGFLREGNFTVDPETKAQAQADIAEDGYWGVNQTSDRIIDFAKALTGGDPEKIDSMIEAFKNGYKEAEKTWGGELPEISKKTYDAVLEKFEALKAPESEI